MFPSTESALLRRVAAEQAENRAPSLIAAVVRNGEALWTGARGYVDGTEPTANTQYRIGSITKTFVAVQVMRLRDEGLVDLNDQVDKHVPGTRLGDRTIAQLLSHTGGVTSESPGQWWERSLGGDWTALAESLGQDALKHRAGGRFHYSNVGFAVLGELVSRLRATSWLDALRDEVLRPLGMTDTTDHPRAPHALGWAVHPHADVLLPEPAPDTGAMAPAGQLWSTVTDLTRWANFISGDTGDVLRQDTMAEMWAPATIDDASTWQYGYGFGLQVIRDAGHRFVGHGGSMPGFLAMLVIDIGTRTGSVTLTNSTTGVGVGALGIELIKTVDQQEPELPAPWQPMTDADPALLALTGLWHWGPSPYVLRLLPERWLSLTPASGGGRASRFRPAGERTWIGLDGYYAGETLSVRPGGGADDDTYLDIATFVFTRRPYDPAAPIPGGVDPGGWRTRG